MTVGVNVNIGHLKLDGDIGLGFVDVHASGDLNVGGMAKDVTKVGEDIQKEADKVLSWVNPFK